ncbi:MAG: NUDIX domain-containing protein [Candidatus Azobacteroides sp.]|nr:NUDIX domain-containing protein [Candidatus Azobacteroides sp.]
MQDHPLHLFKYCPVCGSSNFHVHNFKSKKCDCCGFIYYFNAASSTAAFITNQAGELLVAKRAKEPAKGTLDLPGGFVDMNETAEEAIIREISEETGLKVNSPTYLFSLPNIYVYSGLEIHTVDMFFEMNVSKIAHIHADDDVAELIWLKKENINPDLFGLNSIRQGIVKWLSAR